jgi:hypothetical protein
MFEGTFHSVLEFIAWEGKKLNCRAVPVVLSPEPFSSLFRHARHAQSVNNSARRVNRSRAGVCPEEAKI